MFTEKQLRGYAEVLIWAMKISRTSPFADNDIVLLRYDRPAIRLAEVLYEKLLEMGVNPIQRMTLTPAMEKSFYQLSNDDQIVFQAPGDQELYSRANGSIYLYSPDSITHLSEIDPKRIGKAAVARKHLRDILTEREEKRIFGWTLCAYPTPELAKHADLSIGEYTEQIRKACFLDEENPVGAWEKIYGEAVRIKEWLNGLEIESLHVESDRIDLTVKPGKQRRWIGLSGHNIPSFEIFLSPDWRGTEGRYYANQPSFRSGNFVEGVSLTFKEGIAVEISAEQGEDFVKKQLSMDTGANRVGEFSLTDRRFSRIDRFMANTLFDENYGGEHGNCHLAVGSSYSNSFDGPPESLTKAAKEGLGFNDSALHWDLVNTESKRVMAALSSGERVVIYDDGEFRF